MKNRALSASILAFAAVFLGIVGDRIATGKLTGSARVVRLSVATRSTACPWGERSTAATGPVRQRLGSKDTPSRPA